MKNQRGVTLVALVVTIIVLIILAGISINLILGDNGIITIAKRAKENTELARIEEEKELNELYIQLENNDFGTSDTELGKLKEELAKTNATEEKILKDYKAYSNGKLLTGTMENYAGKTVTVNSIIENGDNAEITIPSGGYYGIDTKVSIPVEIIKNDIKSINKIYYKKISSNRTSLGTNTDKVDFSDCLGFENATISDFIILAGNYYAQFDKNYNHYIKCNVSIVDYDSKTGILTIKTEFVGSGYNGESINTNIGVVLNIE